MMDDDHVLVRVLIGLDAIQLAMACQVLEAERIPFVRHTHDTSPTENPELSGMSTAPVWLKVRQGDFDRAREVLALTVGRGVAPPP
jgi:hypothetical protein